MSRSVERRLAIQKGVYPSNVFELKDFLEARPEVVMHRSDEQPVPLKFLGYRDGGFIFTDGKSTTPWHVAIDLSFEFDQGGFTVYPCRFNYAAL